MCILFDLMHSEFVLGFFATFATRVYSHVQVFVDHSPLSALGCFLICLLREIRRSKLEQSQLLSNSHSNVRFLHGPSNHLSTRIRAAGKQVCVWFVSVLPGPHRWWMPVGAQEGACSRAQRKRALPGFLPPIRDHARSFLTYNFF